MPNYKLTYYDARARGEPARMLLALGGQKYEDVRYTFGGEDWPKVKYDKKRFPFAAMPVLEIDGRVMAQSRAISRYLAKEYGYYSADKDEAFDIDVLMEIVADIEVAFFDPAFDEPDPAKRTALLKKLRDTTFKPFYDFFEESLAKSGGRYFVGNRLTLADIMVYNSVDFFVTSLMKIDGYFDGYPGITKFYQGIEKDSPLSSYLKSRVYSPY